MYGINVPGIVAFGVGPSIGVGYANRSERPGLPNIWRLGDADAEQPGLRYA